MTRNSAALLAVALAFAVDTGIRLIPRSPPPRPADVTILAAHTKALNLDAPSSASTYEFLPAVVGSASVVARGESVHVTSELPRARLRLARFLHERMGFDVLRHRRKAAS